MKRRSPLIRTAFLLLLPAVTLSAIALEAPVTMSLQARDAVQATLLPTVHVVADAHGDAAAFAVAQAEALPVTLMPTVYVHAQVADFAVAQAASDVLLAAADVVVGQCADAFGTLAAQPACIAPRCAAAPY